MTKHLTPKRYGMWISAAMCLLVALLLFASSLLTAMQSLAGHSLIGETVAPLSFWAWLGMLAMGLLCLAGAWVFYGLGVEYLVTGPSGIEKHGHGFTYFSPWENVERVGLLGVDLRSPDPRVNANSAWMAGQLQAQPDGKLSTIVKRLDSISLEGRMEGLILRRPITIEKRSWAWGIIPQTLFIDLSDYPHWRHGSLGQEIRRYAPHLLAA